MARAEKPRSRRLRDPPAHGQDRHAGLARWQATDPERDRLQALVLARRDTVAQRLARTNRLKAPVADPIEAYLAAILACYETQIEAIDREIARHDQSCGDAEVLTGIVGVDVKTAAALPALMPELGQLTRRRVAALANLAPHPVQSGSREAYRRTGGGRPDVKRVLFMAAMSAVRYDGTLKADDDKFLADDRKKLVALTALMRKIVVIADARLRDRAAKEPKSTP